MDRYLRTHSLDSTRDFENKNDNVYYEYENEIKNDIDKSKNIFNEAKETYRFIKKLLLKDDGEIKKMVKEFTPKFL